MNKFWIESSFEKPIPLHISMAYRLSDIRVKVDELFYTMSNDLIINVSYSKSKDEIRQILDSKEPNTRLFDLNGFDENSIIFVEFYGWPVELPEEVREEINFPQKYMILDIDGYNYMKIALEFLLGIKEDNFELATKE